MSFQALTFLLFMLIVLFLLYVLVKPLFRRLKRKQLLDQPFPPEWEEILERNVALYRYLPDPLKKELHGHINVFLGEKNFEGCGGLKITDEIRVTIAAQACILLLNRAKPTYYPTLYSILVYPSAYVAKKVTVEGMQHTEEMSVRGGESWTRGEVVLAWDFVRKAAIDLTFGHNVVLHEFAHQLDQEDGRANGAPILGKSTSYKTWAHVLSHDYEGLRRDALSGRKDIMDAYGATNPAEFFAVATETFFEKPKQMKLAHPELYEELRSYYGLDPLKWFEQGERPADNSAAKDKGD
jgi:Mlc titration factor MtfA (ptsG expression regulator)